MKQTPPTRKLLDKRLLTCDEAAAILGVHRRHVAWLATKAKGEGRLREVVHGGKAHLFEPEEVERVRAYREALKQWRFVTRASRAEEPLPKDPKTAS